ncbi:hypothetical protein [Actinomadura sp. NPDC048394]|jgi:hypothetical protein|uniref:hypothetical protein n=1 Tax=Actinomadura sp. NPDC048394 TaxID=3158223 RepID=UPI0033C435EB
MNDNRVADAAGGAPRPQLLLLTAGAVIGVVLLAAALAVELSGANDPRNPSMPTPTRPAIPNLPTTLPNVPPGSTGMPTDIPTRLPTNFPTEMPSFPTNLPSIPQIPGGAP